MSDALDDMVTGFLDGYDDVRDGRVPVTPGANRSWSYRWGYANALRDHGLLPPHGSSERARCVAKKILERDNRRRCGLAK
jgi:hypothetical protein